MTVERRSAADLPRTLAALSSLLLLAGLLVLSSCGYRLAAVPPIGEPVRVVVSVNQGRLVRLQGYLQEAVAEALESRLGWRVSPSGSAKVELHIEEEHITSSGHDERGVPLRWSITAHGAALLTCQHGNAHTPWQATGYSGGLPDEAEALRQTAHQAADLIATWLENEAGRWPVDAH
jgi:hypothetical protein